MKKFHSGSKNLNDQTRSRWPKTEFQTIDAKLVSSTGMNLASYSPVWFVIFYSLRIQSYQIVPHVTKILLNFASS